MSKSIFLAAALLFCCSSSGATPLDALSEQFELDFRQKLEDAGIPGGAYAIVQGDKIIAARGYGVRAQQAREEINADTVFRIASVSKTFAAEVTGLLVQDGKLNWEDSVNQYLPDFRFKTPNASQALQLRHLMGQSSGLVPNAYDNLLEADQSIEQILPRFRELDPRCPPGNCYGYQNILFSLVQPIIEQTSGATYTELVNQRIFQPLEMHNASVGMGAFLAARNRAQPHTKVNGEWKSSEVKPNYYRALPAAGVNASANDLGKWLIAQLGYKPEVIPPRLIDEVTQARVRTMKDLNRRYWRDHLQDAHYGLGWRIYRVKGEELYYHAGWVQGFVAEIAYSKNRQIGLAILLNAESNVIGDIGSGFWSQLLESEPPAAIARATVPAVKMDGSGS